VANTESIYTTVEGGDVMWEYYIWALKSVVWVEVRYAVWKAAPIKIKMQIVGLMAANQKPKAVQVPQL
jgi:hypothetical protein